MEKFDKTEVSIFKLIEKIGKWKKANGIFVVEFEKKDGTLRQMTCSYDPAVQNKKVAKDSSSYITVFDVIAGGFRTLNYATIKHVVLGKEIFKAVV